SVSPTVTTTYSARTKNTTTGCAGNTCANVTVTVNPSPDATIAAPTSVCASSTGNTASVASAGTGATYLWGITNGSITAGQGTTSVTWTAGSGATTTFTLTVTNSAGCVSQGSQTVTVTSNPTCTVTVTPSGVTAGHTFTASFPAPSATTSIVWSTACG